MDKKNRNTNTEMDYADIVDDSLPKDKFKRMTNMEEDKIENQNGDRQEDKPRTRYFESIAVKSVDEEVIPKDEVTKNAKFPLTNIKNNPYFRQVLVSLGPVVLLGVIGMTEGYATIILMQLKRENGTIPFNTQTSSLIGSISALPMAGGCLAGGFLMEKIGRRGTYIWTCLPMSIGWLLLAAAPNAVTVILGRFLTGIADGLLGPVMAVYPAETSHPKIRDVLISFICGSVTIGMFAIHLLGTFYTWRTCSLICGLIPIPILVLMLCVPESPTYLIKIKRIDDARKAFYWCRGESEESDKEIIELIERQKLLDIAPKISFVEHFKSIKKREFWEPTLLVCVVFITSQLSGHNAVAAYTIQIIQECGIHHRDIDEYVAMMIMDTTRMIASIISCILCKKLGRRSLLMLSGYGVVIALFFVCTYLFISSRTAFDYPIFILTSLAAYVTFASIGFIPSSWILMGEIFPVAYRGMGSAISSSVCYLALYLVVVTFPYLMDLFGSIFDIFVIYFACALCGTIFITFSVPETKDKPLYVIEDDFKNKQMKNDSCKINDKTTPTDH